jgi:hypothetical protein
MTRDSEKELKHSGNSGDSISPDADGDRRLGIDRRRFSYDVHIPERRTGEERRYSAEHRNGNGYRLSPKQRSNMDRRATFA